MAPYIKWRYITALIIGIICVVIVSGCVNLISTPISPTSSATTAPTVAPQTPKQTILQPRASPDTRNADTQTMPKQTVYNSPENGPRMPDLPAYKGPLPTITPSVTPTPKPTATPIIIR
jgi:hypothetical protein